MTVPAFVLAIVLLFAVVFLVFAGRNKSKTHQGSPALAQAIGQQREKLEGENHRKTVGNVVELSLPEEGYDFWRGETSVLDLVPSPLDSKLSEYCRVFAKSNAPTRAKLRDAITEQGFDSLLTFSWRSATLAIRKSDVNHLVDGLTALAIMNDKTDPPDILMPLSMLHHAARKIGQQPDKLIRNAAALSQKEIAEVMIAFSARSPEEMNLRDVAGLAEVETGNGIGFIGWQGADYQPTHDLTRAIIEISRLVAADRYQPDDVSVAQELPAVWLESSSDEKNRVLAEALGAVRGGASLLARLPPGTDPTHESQSLMIFVVEMADESASQTLLDLSKSKQPDYGMTAVADGRLFCLVIGRSSRSGVTAVETSASLNRFIPEIVSILGRAKK